MCPMLQHIVARLRERSLLSHEFLQSDEKAWHFLLDFITFCVLVGIGFFRILKKKKIIRLNLFGCGYVAR